MEVYIGMIFLFAGDFAPRGFQLCNGQLLSIQSYSALFSILGTHFGGDGVRTFGLPNLQGQFPIGTGTSATGTYIIGETGGAADVTLLINNMPQHTHTLNGDQAAGGKVFPGPNHVLGGNSAAPIYSANAPNTTLSPKSIGPAGSNLPFSILPPYQAFSYIIAITGLYPSRN
ncbi:MAG TPA: tail fiber protein [Candidatus Baltobacteraceae bacterium]|nr:tail fiber protein [Candidatus Baltobacteraceae bacterium]